jgi:ankyrin repeat protein
MDDDLNMVKILVFNGADVNAKSAKSVKLSNMSDSLLIKESLQENVAMPPMPIVAVPHSQIAQSLNSNMQVAESQPIVMDSGYTPLHFAAAPSVDVEITKFLVSKGANVNAKSTRGKTPLDVAKQRGHRAVVEYLSGLK